MKYEMKDRSNNTIISPTVYTKTGALRPRTCSFPIFYIHIGYSTPPSAYLSSIHNIISLTLNECPTMITYATHIILKDE